jgi:MFS family permease
MPSFIAFRNLIIRRDLLVPSLLNIIGQYVGVVAVFSFGPILAQQLGAGNITLGLLVTWNLIFYALGNLSATIFSRFITRRYILISSFVLMSAGLGIIAFAQSLIWVFIAHACYGFAGGNSYPVLMGLSIENVLSDERSSAMGLHQTIYSIGTFLGPWLSGILAKQMGIQPMFGATAFVSLVLGIVGVCSLSGGKQNKSVSP